MKYPRNQEHLYVRYLRTMIRELRLLINKHVKPIIPRLVKEALNTELPSGPVKFDQDYDGWRQRLYEELRRVERDMVAPEANVISSLMQIANGTNEYNKQEWRSIIRQAYSVSPTEEEPERYAGILEEWSRTNAMLIRSVPVRVRDQIAERIQAALEAGTTIDDTIEDIYEVLDDRIDVAESRVELIARDQTAKLNAALTRERQEEVGVERYIWRTVGDERVRETHAECDGQEFDWDNPPTITDGNHPGEDYQCRCWAEPLLPLRLEFEASLMESEEV